MVDLNPSLDFKSDRNQKSKSAKRLKYADEIAHK